MVFFEPTDDTACYSSKNDVTGSDILGIYDIFYSVCFGIDVCDVKRPKTSHNATNGSMVTDSLLQSHLTEIGFGSNLILMVLFQGFANVGLRG